MGRTLKDLDISDEVIVFNQKYSIVYPLKVDGSGIDNTENAEFSGVVSYPDQKIQLKSGSHGEYQLKTLFHELGHLAFVDIVRDAETIDVESACEAVARLLYDMCHNFEIKYRGEK